MQVHFDITQKFVITSQSRGHGVSFFSSIDLSNVVADLAAKWLGEKSNAKCCTNNSNRGIKIINVEANCIGSRGPVQYQVKKFIADAHAKIQLGVYQLRNFALINVVLNHQITGNSHSRVIQSHVYPMHDIYSVCSMPQRQICFFVRLQMFRPRMLLLIWLRMHERYV